jgi:hypothetical protein
MSTSQNTIHRASFKPVIIGFFRIVVYGLLVVGLAEFIQWDASQFMGDSKFSEDSYTEIMQSVFLALSTGLLAYLYLTESPLRYSALLMMGLTGAAFFREQDLFFENTFGNGTWQIPVYLLLAMVIYQVVRNRIQFSQELKLYTQSTSFGVFLGGLLTTFAFSRLFGRKTFWYEVMGDQYFRAVKNAAEECLELYGYLFIFISVIELFLLSNTLRKADLAHSFVEIRQLLKEPEHEASTI